MTKKVAVLGAGMVGTACALALRRAGWDVTLIDRREPGRETSYGNAGVLARSSLIPFNNPTLWAALPRLLKNRGAAFRYDAAFLARHPGWALGFLRHARRAAFARTVPALDALIRLSGDEHRVLLAQAGVAQRLRERGWLFLYRSEDAFAGGAPGRAVMREFGVATQALTGAALAALEPALAPIFPRALWVQDAASVDSPGAVVEAYAALFAAEGGQVRRARVTGVRPAAGRWAVRGEDVEDLHVDRVVVALGPWAPDLLRDSLGLRVPMAWERGYHMHYGARDGATLNRPVYDTGGGYVLSPMAQGLRLTSGVQLTDRDAPHDATQLNLAERAAREAFPLAERLAPTPWLGSRPTMPDSRPVIGAATRHPGLWYAFGHQHIGFSTGPGTARLLAQMMAGEATAIDARPFAPARFGL